MSEVWGCIGAVQGQPGCLVCLVAEKSSREQKFAQVLRLKVMRINTGESPTIEIRGSHGNGLHPTYMRPGI